ncbi:ferritin family protein [Halalkalicoccus subterraneus]|uniref:ferritin-like domain-containing protein n=1 Tax=Halalkalicoccus subterraneus TaxID=2675002 RepID=UPI000EFD4E47|nr:ferritin-like domain-containing protein [Halalkalicoccus subterraneus]
MSLATRVGSDRQLARLLQIGVVLEEVVEARAYHHHQSLSTDEQAELDDRIEHLLEHAAEESAEHRSRLEELIDELDAESVAFEEIEALVDGQYGQTKPDDFDGILYDQLHSEETAYKFYDDLIEAIEGSDATFDIDRKRLLATLRAIRAEEEEGVRDVTEIMEERE